ncbi:MAG: hypothetical protein AAB385_06375, partial [Planctomycetota bacterium]
NLTYSRNRSKTKADASRGVFFGRIGLRVCRLGNRVVVFGACESAENEFDLDRRVVFRSPGGVSLR